MLPLCYYIRVFCSLILEVKAFLQGDSEESRKTKTKTLSEVEMSLVRLWPGGGGVGQV